MKKRYFVIPIIIVFVTCITFYQKKINSVIENSRKEIKKPNALTLNFETVGGSGEYTASTNNNWPTTGYIFNEKISGCKNGSEISYDKSTGRVIVKANVEDQCYVYFDILTLVKQVKSQYTEQGSNGLYYHDATLANGAGDNSYRYAGANPNNWVCFGMDDETGVYAEGWCDNEHLYRIIGVFDSVVIGEDGNSTGETESRVKLIKAYEGTETSLGTAPSGTAYRTNTYYKGKLTTSPGYKWKDAEPNNWTESTLNTNVLNGTYLTILGADWTSKIATTEWKIGGNLYENISKQIPSITYQNEIINFEADTNGDKTYNSKIGFMYMSDYGFAASPVNWTTIVLNYNNETNRNNNWLFLGVNEWTISRWIDNLVGTYYLQYDGAGSCGTVSFHYIARPSFYLNTSVAYVSGSGTSSNPYRIN